MLLFIRQASANFLYVNVNGSAPTPPYTNWSIAATNIQAAVDAASAGDTVLVTNGVYTIGGRNWFGSGTNRVTLTNSVTLRSVNGPAFTWIVGGHASSVLNATRCVLMNNGSVVSGFTLTNGQAGGGNYPSGGGVSGGIATNCILINNLATNNLGGGAYRTTLINCKIIGNSAYEGGGASSCTLINCLVLSNTATANGGGVYGDSTSGTSSLTNCTIAGNSAVSTGGGVNISGGGALENCIVYYNTAPSGSNYANIKLNYCCTTPILVSDITCTTNPPLFVDFNGGNYRLQSNSPCINTGGNTYAPSTADLDGRPRIIGSTIDMGAYEFQTNASGAFIGWLQQNNLPADGSADFADPDGDGMNNWQEFITGTNPTNTASVLAMTSAAPPSGSNPARIGWQGVSTRTYFLQRSTNLTSGFSIIISNILGYDGANLIYDTTATNGGNYLYRIGVQ